MIELSLPEERDTLAQLFSRMQIQKSRLDALHYGTLAEQVSQRNVEDFLQDTAEIYARVATMYAFGRGDEATLPSTGVSAETFMSAVRNLRLDDELSERAALYSNGAASSNP